MQIFRKAHKVLLQQESLKSNNNKRCDNLCSSKTILNHCNYASENGTVQTMYTSLETAAGDFSNNSGFKARKYGNHLSIPNLTINQMYDEYGKSFLKSSKSISNIGLANSSHDVEDQEIGDEGEKARFMANNNGYAVTEAQANDKQCITALTLLKFAEQVAAGMVR